MKHNTYETAFLDKAIFCIKLFMNNNRSVSISNLIHELLFFSFKNNSCLIKLL